MKQPSSAVAEAARTQNIASDPRVSAFVSASAGSGKTKLLIDRLLRLMLPVEGLDEETGDPVLLPGSDPARIQCLTFTKAAAAEMANRLQSRLGQWVSLPDEALRAELASLEVPVDSVTLQAARDLFARVLDIPGGMKIGTIHAFCQSLLRRFPIEASVNPHFTLLEDADATLALNSAIERHLARAATVPALHACLTQLASQTGLETYLRQLRALGTKNIVLAPPIGEDARALTALYRHLVGASDETIESLETQLLCPPNEETLRRVLNAALTECSATMEAHLLKMLDWLASTQDGRDSALWRALLLTGDGEPRKQRSFVKASLAKTQPEIMEVITAEAERILALSAEMAAQQLLALNVAMFSLAGPTLRQYAQDKAMRGQVDYGDLINSARDLLHEPGAAWVLYKLDGGIDHLLLDEVQDTSGTQWEIAGALTAEFFAGEGAREGTGRPRTVFAVGDFKQSIYRFQGADPEGFHEWRERFSRMVRQAGEAWRDPGLTVSFRSVPPVLTLVDAVFAQENAAYGLKADGAGTSLPPHISARAGQGGKVELWPLVPNDADQGTADPWSAPAGNAHQTSPPQRLADELAKRIAKQIGQPVQPGQKPLRAGDILVLVPRRSTFLRGLIRALKAAGVPVATLVRVPLIEQLAVKDLLALCEALLLPQDDLMLACVLTSPIGGLSDESLMALAMGRQAEPLWTALRERHEERPDWAAAWALLAGLQRRVDFATPYEILADALGRHGARARMLARLGQEAVEPIDDLLAAALRFEGLNPPSMQGFLAWLKASQATVKREPEVAADAVRIMTVHGAKGLQARLVILPDMMAKEQCDTTMLWDDEAEAPYPIWMPGGGLGTEKTAALIEQVRDDARAEWHRLLYVALTRASDALIICGWEGKRAPPEDCWYHLCRAGFRAVAADAVPFDGPWEGECLVIEEAVPPGPGVAETKGVSEPVVSLPPEFGAAPSWRSLPVAPEPALARPLSPSRPDAATFGLEPSARSPLDVIRGVRVDHRARALRRGTIVHRLLQLLPTWPVEGRELRAHDWLHQHGEAQDATAVIGQLLAVMAHPFLAPLFGLHGRAEQGVTGIVAGRVVVGQVDRLAVTPEGVFLCDYKTNRNPPRDEQAIPRTYLTQMAAYAALLQQLHPGLPIHASLVWTEGPKVSLLTEEMLAEGLAALG